MTAALDAIRARHERYGLGDRPHTLYSGHDCYVCAAHDRRILLAALDRAEAALLPIVKQTAGISMCSQTHHEHLGIRARAALRAIEDADKVADG